MIYFVQTDDNRYIKIGYANDVKKRVDNLRTSSPHALKLLASMPGDVAIEKSLHGQFARHRTNREWFESHPDIVRMAVSANRLTGFVADSEPFLKYAVLAPQLIDLLVEAASATPDSDDSFCANDFFFRYHNPRAGLKHRLSKLVGHYAKDSWHPDLLTSQAYDVVYDRIYEALPNCRNCGCPDMRQLMGY